MKEYKQVQETRKEYNKNSQLNSVHRSSLMVPEVLDTKAEISFLNHFLLKRNYPKVACKITAIDKNGKKIESKLYTIDQPIVYTIPLTGMVESPVSNYIVEFFASENLFIPFPAVMVNHKGKEFFNQVHSFNRILNDIFENDDINSNQVKEASVDLKIDDNTDTFLLFTGGPFPCKAPFEVEIKTNGKTFNKNYDLDIPRFGTENISIKKLFPEIKHTTGGIIKALQPQQMLFYGRMLVGQTINNKAFSANHSYYDSSTTEEYWPDDRPSQRFYPYFENLNNIIRLYPIHSPSNLEILLSLHDDNGNKITEYNLGNLESPSNNFFDVNINSKIQEQNLESNNISTFSITANVLDGKMPTRIGHQLVYDAGSLASSIAVSLFNPNIFNPPHKKSFKWGQIVSGGDYDSFVGIVADPGENNDVSMHDSKITFYNENGKLAQRQLTINTGNAKKFIIGHELKEELGSNENQTNLWCTVEGEKVGLNFYSVAYNKNSKNCSGDHGF